MLRSPHIIPPDQILDAYASGYFPMAGDDGRIEWYTADPRATLPLDPFHVPRRLARLLKRAPYRYTHDQEFEAVIRACADRESTWISEGIIRSYMALHEAGFAHSVEVWRDTALVGGLYGVALGGAFFGESMFHRDAGASKAALVHLAGHLRARDFRLLEIQMVTPLTEQFRPVLLSRRGYLPVLRRAIAAGCSW